MNKIHHNFTKYIKKRRENQTHIPRREEDKHMEEWKKKTKEVGNSHSRE